MPGRRPAFRLRRVETSSIKSDSPAYLDIKGWTLSGVMSRKMRKTMLVGGELSSRSPHYEGSERDDSVKGVKGGWTLSDDVISSKMRETMLVGGKLSSRGPHYEGSERDDSVKVVKRGLDPFWWRELKQRHDECLMNWKWRYRDHPCRSQNLPQNICNYYINELILELSSWWQRSEAVGTRRSRRRPGRDQQIRIVLCAANSYIASPPLGQIVVKKTWT